jgi:hypothetical protein
VPGPLRKQYRVHNAVPAGNFQYGGSITQITYTPMPAFFNGQASLGSHVYYLRFPNSTLFGYYNLLPFPIFYHCGQ